MQRNVNDGLSSETSDNEYDATEQKDDEEFKKKDFTENQEKKSKRKRKDVLSCEFFLSFPRITIPNADTVGKDW